MFVYGKPLKSALKFVGKARSLPEWSTLVYLQILGLAEKSCKGKQARVFGPGKPLRLSLIFAGKARSLPKQSTLV